MQQQALQLRLKTCLRQFEEGLGAQVSQCLEATDMIFAGQMLLEGARDMEEGEDRRAALDNSLLLAGQASGLSRQSGDTGLVSQAQALVAEIRKVV